MWDYFSMFLWVIIAFIGLVIYMNPSFLVRHTYEGFQSTTAIQPTEQQQQQQQQQPVDMNVMMRNLEQLLNTPGNAPDLHPSMLTSTEVGDGDKKSSTPQPLNHPIVASDALAQGKAFQSIKPKEIIKERIVEVPVPRTCPKQQECPICPDMTNYIRKDSIPCWACKL